MKPPRQNVRINLVELKSQIVKKLGPERSKQYFYFFNRFLSLRVSKGEFDKLCYRILGRENIPLHNQLIRSILKNACTQKSPPPAGQKDDVLKQVTHVGSKNVTSDGYENGLHIGMTQASDSLGSLPNGGDILPLSPRKARSSNCDRRTTEHGSVLEPNGTTSFPPQLPTSVQSNKFSVVFENGCLDKTQIGRPVHHHQGFMQQPDNLNEISLPHPAKSSVIRRFSDSSSHSYGKDQANIVVRDDVKQVFTRTQLQAPLGVPFCPVSIGGACRSLPQSSSHSCIGTFIDGALLGSLTLRERMEQIAVEQGLEGVSMDCANILNHGLDSYLKGIIMSCIELVGPKSGHELRRNNTHKLQARRKLINGIRPGHQYRMLSSSQASEVQQQRNQCPISLLDFKVAMDLNPQQLGEDWPLLLEKICTTAFEK